MIAVTREVSRTLGRCDLQHLDRQEIDAGLAAAQHREYVRCLEQCGARIVAAPALHDLPDAVFVEDPAVVVGEVAVMTRMKSPVRRKEAESVAQVLQEFRPLRWLREPATLEGGDVLIAGRWVFVGLSSRTNQAGVDQLTQLLAPLGYSVRAVEVRGCLHLKTACSLLPDARLLANRSWIDTAAFAGFNVVDVPESEPFAANVLAVGERVLVAECFPATRRLLENVQPVDISELMKAEAGLTCMSLLLDQS